MYVKSINLEWMIVAYLAPSIRVKCAQNKLLILNTFYNYCSYTLLFRPTKVIDKKAGMYVMECH